MGVWTMVQGSQQQAGGQQGVLQGLQGMHPGQVVLNSPLPQPPPPPPLQRTGSGYWAQQVPASPLCRTPAPWFTVWWDGPPAVPHLKDCLGMHTEGPQDLRSQAESEMELSTVRSSGGERLMAAVVHADATAPGTATAHALHACWAAATNGLPSASW